MSYGGYGKPDPYSAYMSGGRYAPAADAAGMGAAGMGASAALGLGSLGLGAAGTAIGAYGAYKAWEQEQDRMREEQRRYEEQERIGAMERQKRDEQNRLSQIQGFGGYAQSLGDERLDAYRRAVR